MARFALSITKQEIRQELLKSERNDLDQWLKYEKHVRERGENAYLELSHDRRFFGPEWQRALQTGEKDWDTNPLWLDMVKHRVDGRIEYEVARARESVERLERLLKDDP